MNMELAERYIPLAESMACRRSRSLPRNVTFDEVKSAAYFALVDAASKYDPGRGVPFPVYARTRISGGITDCFRGVRYYPDEVGEPEERPRHDLLETEDFFEFVSEELGDEDGKSVRMHYFEGRSLKEVGAARGVSESRASQILGDCRDRLRRRMMRKAFA